MSEKKTTSFRNQDQKTVKAETKKINKLSIHISTNNIPKLNKLIYAGAKLVCTKISVPQKKMDRNSKPRLKIRLEKQIRNLQ